MSKTLENALVTVALAVVSLLVIWFLGSFTAVKILVILVVWFAILGLVALGIESATQAIAKSFKRR
ncbi:MAG TPA: hypothetical protein VNT32_05180 [Thermoleophilaceae bacterium]|nr:hypothetical protein [Thermoleophilaceae bacterium]